MRAVLAARPKVVPFQNSDLERPIFRGIEGAQLLNPEFFAFRFQQVFHSE
jgi:hypothetical protein